MPRAGRLSKEQKERREEMKYRTKRRLAVAASTPLVCALTLLVFSQAIDHYNKHGALAGLTAMGITLLVLGILAAGLWGLNYLMD